MIAVSDKPRPTVLRRGGLHLRATVAVILITVADWLFFNQPLGISIAAFSLVLAAAAIIANPTAAPARRIAVSVTVLLVCLMPVVEDCNPLSVFFSILGVTLFVQLTMAGLPSSLAGKLLEAALQPVPGFIRDFETVEASVEMAPAPLPQPASPLVRSLAIWIVPFLLGGIFIGLFAIANPLLGNLFEVMDLRAALRAVLDLLSPLRMLFWFATFVATWSFVANYVPSKPRPVALPPQLSLEPEQPANFLFNDASITRSLMVFNLIFAVQTASDISFLWSGVALPRGLTYADYAHRGAAPLIVAALLAGAFVLVTMRPGGAAERSYLMRALVFAWIAQTVMLVLSSILRLDLYVSVYSLTLLRVAAFVWMGLIAGGLALIVARIAMRWPNGWLIDANLTLLLVTLYACCFVNVPQLIASYNIGHDGQPPYRATQCRDVDVSYLASLGPQVLPALDTLRAENPSVCDGADNPAHIIPPRWQLINEHVSRMANWRAWSFRGWRLSKYLEAHAYD